MSNFLFYSDYVRFIEDLKECRDLKIVADLMRDFSDFYIDYNPSFFYVFLDALWREYPEYDLECNSDLIFEYDEGKFSEFSNPRMEFVGQYLYYLADEQFEKQLAIESTKNESLYDFEEEAFFVKDVMSDNNDTSVIDIPVSFGIKEKHYCNVLQIIDSISEVNVISTDEDFSSNFANLFTSKNISDIPNELKTFHLRCQTNFFVLFIDEVQATFKVKFKDNFFDKYCTVYTKTQTKLTSNSIQSARKRNANILGSRGYNDIIPHKCNQFSPTKYSC